MELECSEEEFKIFESLVRDNDFKCSFTRDLLLVLLGVKPGCAANTYWEVSENRNMIRDIGLKIKKVKLGFAEIPEWGSEENEEEFKHQFFVTRNAEKLEILEDRYSDEELNKFRRDFGVFCGYPEEDVEWFIQGQNSDVRDAVEEFESSEFEVAEPKLINYVPKPEEDRIRGAEEISGIYRSALLQADKVFNSSIGRELIDLRS